MVGDNLDIAGVQRAEGQGFALGVANACLLEAKVGFAQAMRPQRDDRQVSRTGNPRLIAEGESAEGGSAAVVVDGGPQRRNDASAAPQKVSQRYAFQVDDAGIEDEIGLEGPYIDGVLDTKEQGDCFAGEELDIGRVQAQADSSGGSQ